MRRTCLLFIATSAWAADPFYLGTWKIASAVEAPWADAQHKDDAAEMKSLVGKAVVFKSIETGCGNELDFHFIDPATTTFGLNNYVYTLKKQ